MPAPGMGPGSAGGIGGPGSLGGSGKGSPGGFGGKDGKKKDKPRAQTLLDDPNTLGLPSQVPGATPPGQLPPGLNPQKYTPNDNVSYEATLSNLAKAAATAGLVGPTTAPAVIGGAITGTTDDLGLGYDNPTGIVGGADYDAAQVKEINAAPTSSRDTNPTVEQLQKKKKPLAPGYTLLAGQPGTLLGS